MPVPIGRSLRVLWIRSSVWIALGLVVGSWLVLRSVAPWMHAAESPRDVAAASSTNASLDAEFAWSEPSAVRSATTPEQHVVDASPAMRSTAKSTAAPASFTSSNFESTLIRIQADWLHDWTSGRERIGLFHGRCRISQGERALSGERMVVWSERSRSDDGQGVDRVLAYLEGESSGFELHEFESVDGLAIEVRGRETDAPQLDDACYVRAAARRAASRPRSQLQLTQWRPEPPSAGPALVAAPPPATGSGLRRVRIFPRSSTPLNWQSRPTPGRNPPEQVTYITGGVNVLIDGVANVDGSPEFGIVDLSADNVVIWTQSEGGREFSAESLQPRDMPYQLYLEGNIVIREGDNVVRAARAFYDAREQRAVIENAELFAMLPGLDANLRIRAERVRQLSRDSYLAQNAWVTTSQFGVPTYRFQVSDALLDRRFVPATNPDGSLFTDPLSGRPMARSQPWITTENNTLLLGEIPLLYSPHLSGPAEDPKIPLDNLQFRQDGVFGTQIRSHWDMFGLTGLDRPTGVKWGLEADYLGKRGPLLGTDGSYDAVDFWGNRIVGGGMGMYVHDDGVDNIGFDRRQLAPNDSNRGRFLWRHRSFLPADVVFQAEAGFVSDRNLLEQYYEREFDADKDQETLASLGQQRDRWGWSVLVRPQVNQFENNTQWLPRADGYVLGQPLLSGLLTWSTHSSIGYANMERAQAPLAGTEVFTPLPYYIEAQGLTAMTRHEVQAPFSLGPLQFAPYALGEAAVWGDGASGEGIERLYGRAGVRASVSAWNVFPEVQSDVLNLNGLAHKMTFELDYGISHSSRSLSDIPQWNEFDDDAQERFRQRFPINTFGGVLPGIYDPRGYAVRAGAGGNLADPYHELVASQHALRLGWQHRWQTKVGPPNRLRTKDFMTLDLGATFFPQADRDNFGENWGLLTARYAWHASDRTSLLAGATTDLFDGGQKLWNVGVLSQRSLRGSVYLGVRQIRAGALDSQIATASASYRMSPGWISTVGTAYDISEGQNRGQSLTITRVLPDFLLHLGFGFDASRDNASVGISLEPRFGKNRVSSIQLESLLDAGY